MFIATFDSFRANARLTKVVLIFKCGDLFSLERTINLALRLNFYYFQFKAISQAYEVLSDTNKREIYDRGGEQAIKDGGSGGSGGFRCVLSKNMFLSGLCCG